MATLTRTFCIPLTLVLSLGLNGGCGSEADDADATKDGSTGGTAGSDTGDSPASDATTSGPTSQGSTSEGGSETTAGGSETSADSSTDESAGEESTEGTDGVDVDPAELPFGGLIVLAAQDGGFAGDALFYTLEELGPDVVAIGQNYHEPVVPLDKEAWIFDNFEAQTPLPKAVSSVAQLQVANEFYLDAGGLEFTYAYVGQGNLWNLGGFNQLKEPYPGGELTIDIPANGEAPAATFTDIPLMSGVGDADFQVALDDTGTPTDLTWTPQTGAHHVTLIMLSFGGGPPTPLCVGRVPDTGSLAVPQACRDAIPEENHAEFYVHAEHTGEVDVAYGDYRVRVKPRIAQTFFFPFAPLEGPAPKPSLAAQAEAQALVYTLQH